MYSIYFDKVFKLLQYNQIKSGILVYRNSLP